jgi:hypothetical protein
MTYSRSCLKLSFLVHSLSSTSHLNQSAHNTRLVDNMQADKEGAGGATAPDTPHIPPEMLQMVFRRLGFFDRKFSRMMPCLKRHLNRHCTTCTVQAGIQSCHVHIADFVLSLALSAGLQDLARVSSRR